MQCPGCRAQVPGNRKFCGDCGTPLPWFCQTCGGENTARSRFCGECGAPSASGSVPPALAREAVAGSGELERRHLTVVFVDLVGSTELSTRLDLEDFRDSLRSWQSCVTALITRYGGLVTRHMGDGVLAFFGYPRADEADAERAVRAGLAMIEAAGRLDTPAGPPGTLQTRVGVATGFTIVGNLIGAGASLERPAFGETPNLAARLQTLAGPDMLVIDQVTRQLLGEMFEYDALGPVRLKGIPTLICVWAVLRDSEVESRFQALHSGFSPLVGREEEAAMVERRWAKARGGAGQVVVIAGEAGLGKSRLIAALEEQIGSKADSTHRIDCSPHFQDTPLFPFIRYFEAKAGFERADPPSRKLAKLRDLLRGVKGLDEIEVMSLTGLLSIGEPAKGTGSQTIQARKDLVFNAIIRYFGLLAFRAPQIAVVEDFHWADPTTAALLDAIVSQIERFPALLIITTRPEKSLLWSLQPHVTTQILNGLDRHQAAELAKHVAGERSLPDKALAQIVDRGEGVPLFIEELTRAFLNFDTVEQPVDLYGQPVSPSGDIIPMSLKGLLMARLDQLGPGKEVAQASSVIGRDFSFDMLKAVSGLPDERLEHALADLAQARMILPVGHPNDRTYVFRHTLIQDTAYTSMLRDRRRRFHLGYAEALERTDADFTKTTPELLAAHFAEAGFAEKAIDYYLAAAARATGRFALTESIGYLRKGLQQVANRTAAPAMQHRELELRMALGRALIEHRGAGDEEVRATFERAHELCLLLEQDEFLPHIYDGFANYHFAHSALDKVVEAGDQALEFGQRTGNLRSIVMAYRTTGHGKLLLGRFAEARDELEKACDQYKNETGFTRDPKVSACGALGICLTMLGMPTSGASVSLTAIRHAEQLAHPMSLNLALRRGCIQAMLRGDIDRVATLAERLLTEQNDRETFRESQEGRFFSTWASLQRHHDTSLSQQLYARVYEMETAGVVNFLPFFMLAACDLMILHGDRKAAAALLRHATELITKTNERWCEAEVLRLRARLTDDAAAAARLLGKSLDLAREQAAVLWERRAAMDLGDLLKQRGRSHGGLRHLPPRGAAHRQRGMINLGEYHA